MTETPTSVTSEKSWFDRFASAVNVVVSRASFFCCCVLLVLLWAPSWPLFDSGDTFQLAINTPTTVVTFLLVALTANTTKRADAAIQGKLNAIAEALADLMDDQPGMAVDTRELRAAVGLEEREGA